MTIKVKSRDGESGERLLKRFSSHVKSRKLPQVFRKLRYFSGNVTARKRKLAAIKREEYRKVAKKKQFLSQ